MNILHSLLPSSSHSQSSLPFSFPLPSSSYHPPPSSYHHPPQSSHQAPSSSRNHPPSSQYPPPSAIPTTSLLLSSSSLHPSSSMSKRCVTASDPSLFTKYPSFFHSENPESQILHVKTHSRGQSIAKVPYKIPTMAGIKKPKKDEAAKGVDECKRRMEEDGGKMEGEVTSRKDESEKKMEEKKKREGEERRKEEEKRKIEKEGRRMEDEIKKKTENGTKMEEEARRTELVRKTKEEEEKKRMEEGRKDNRRRKEEFGGKKEEGKIEVRRKEKQEVQILAKGSISIARRRGDLLEIEEVGSDEEKKNERKSTSRRRKNLESEQKSDLSFPEELTFSAQKNIFALKHTLKNEMPKFFGGKSDMEGNKENLGVNQPQSHMNNSQKYPMKPATKVSTEKFLNRNFLKNTENQKNAYFCSNNLHTYTNENSNTCNIKNEAALHVLVLKNRENWMINADNNKDVQIYEANHQKVNKDHIKGLELRLVDLPDQAFKPVKYVQPQFDLLLSNETLQIPKKPSFSKKGLKLEPQVFASLNPQNTPTSPYNTKFQRNPWSKPPPSPSHHLPPPSSISFPPSSLHPPSFSVLNPSTSSSSPSSPSRFPSSLNPPPPSSTFPPPSSFIPSSLPPPPSSFPQPSLSFNSPTSSFPQPSTFPMQLPSSSIPSSSNSANPCSSFPPSISSELSRVSDSIQSYLISCEGEVLDPYYLSKQFEITTNMRTILIDWMVEVCFEFSLKRQTLQMAIRYLDSFLAKSKVVKEKLQLVGVCTLMIASKIEEVTVPGLSEFRRACDDGFSVEEMCEIEQTILKVLCWRLTPACLQNWTEIYLSQWDLFASRTNINIKFRSPDQDAYLNYTFFCQILDCCLLELDVLQYRPRILVAGLLYLIVGFKSSQFPKTTIINVFSKTSRFLFEFDRYNELFLSFLKRLGLEMIEIYPAVQFLSVFFEMEEGVVVPKGDVEKLMMKSYEEVLCLQIHHPKNLDFVRRKSRK